MVMMEALPTEILQLILKQSLAVGRDDYSVVQNSSRILLMLARLVQVSRKQNARLLVTSL